MATIDDVYTALNQLEDRIKALPAAPSSEPSDLDNVLARVNALASELPAAAPASAPVPADVPAESSGGAWTPTGGQAG